MHCRRRGTGSGPTSPFSRGDSCPLGVSPVGCYLRLFSHGMGDVKVEWSDCLECRQRHDALSRISRKMRLNSGVFDPSIATRKVRLTSSHYSLGQLSQLDWPALEDFMRTRVPCPG